MRLAICLLLLVPALFSSCKKDDIDYVMEEKNYVNLSYGPDNAQKLDLFLPAGRTSETKLLVFVHGGGWNDGDKSDYSMVLQQLQNMDIAIANINYRLADAGKGILLPQLQEDVRSAVDYLADNSSKYVYSDAKIILAGHSAGGHLALFTAYTNNADGLIKAVISLAGPTDLTDPYFQYNTDLNALIENMAGIAYSANAQVWVNDSPIHYVQSDVVPTLLQYCGLDFTVPYTQGEELHEELDEVGAENTYLLYPYYGHDMGTINNYGFLPSDVLADLRSFIDAHAND
ncbi:MAG: alpha/beta hydrolase [Chitinophagales bacterium]